MILLVVYETGPSAIGGAALRQRGLASALAATGEVVTIFQVRRVRRRTGCRCTDCWKSAVDDLDGADPYVTFWCAAVADVLRDEIRSSRPTAVVVSDLRLHRYLDVAQRAGADRVAIDLHNCEADLYEELAAYMSAHGFSPSRVAFFTETLGVRPPANGRTADAIKSVEHRACSAGSAVSAASTVDAVRLAERHGVPYVHAVPNSVEVDGTPLPDPSDGPPSLLFLGVLDYLPNAVAALSLVRDIFPAIAAAHPDARLTVAGRRPLPELRDAIGDPRIQLIADPPDTRPLLTGSTLVVPLELGSGTRLKILEAFRAGTPVMSSAKGMEGIDAIAGTHYLAAETPADHVAAVDAITASPDAGVARRQAALDLVTRVYSWEAIRDPVNRMVKDLLP
jgi:glycosyltransferase involved in cell wall biosynthesis